MAYQLPFLESVKASHVKVTLMSSSRHCELDPARMPAPLRIFMLGHLLVTPGELLDENENYKQVQFIMKSQE